MPGPPPAKRVRFAEGHTVAAAPAAAAAGDSAAEMMPGGALGGGENAVEEKLHARHRNTIDSDEEEAGGGEAEEEFGSGHRHGRMREEDIEGQEEATIANDDGIAITPFNMREEMQEGYFDSAGCYIFKKEKEIHDNWLDNVDWETIKRGSSGSGKAEPERHHRATTDDKKDDNDSSGGSNSDRDNDPDNDDDDGDDSEELGPAQLAEICAAARALLAGPGETVASAIKRLGGGANKALTASQRLRLRKSGSASGGASAESVAAAAANRGRMLELSELAGRLVSAGHMAAYQMDARQLAQLGGISDGEAAAAAAAAAASSNVDMFAADEATDKDSASNKDDSTMTQRTGESGGSSAVQWYYRTEQDNPSAEVHGPFSSRRMLAWSLSEAGWPPGGHRVVYVRKAVVNSSGDSGTAGGSSADASSAAFYSSARIDFELYDDDEDEDK